jgi:3-hydroxyisobutyrate dehydrogenase
MTDVRQARLGVVGLGRMGANMARRLADQGFMLGAVHDVRPEVAAELARELGCPAAKSLAEVTSRSEVILTVVTDDAAMRAIFTPDHLLRDAGGKVFVNFATVSPAVHRELAAALAAAGAQAMEACMASSITQAREGTLFLILGGDPALVERMEPLLAAISSARRYVGATGRGAQVKALVNMVMNINTAGLAEGLGLGAALGLDLTALREVFAHTGANSRVLETDGADMQAREHECYFSAAHAAKDSGIAVELAQEAGVKTPLAEAALRQYRLMIEKGLGELDKSGVAELTFKARAEEHPRSS